MQHGDDTLRIIMTFECRVVKYEYAALEPLYFPAGKAGNMLRGAFGLMPGTAAIFRPAPAEPSGLKDPPRPFVFRAAHLESRRFLPGELFSFNVHLFDKQIPAGIFGKIWSDRATLHSMSESVVRVNFDHVPASAVTVRFLTPTELKPAGSAEFNVLFARARDRVSTLRSLYGPGPLPIEFRRMGEESEQIRMIYSDLRYLDFERHSSRTGQTHPLGGFTGEVRYAGELAEFIPYLRAAELTGVGRHTVWGKGVISVAIS
jgi:hypothetical protein